MKSKLLVLTFSLALISVCYGGAKTVQNSNTASKMTQATTSDNVMMITATLTIKADKIKDFIAAAKEMIANAHKEAGCLSYQLYQDPYENTKFIFVEKYKNQAAVDAHFATDYFKAFGAKIADLVAEPSKIQIISIAKETTK
jgi:quinol monooxygenase YgiN